MLHYLAQLVGPVSIGELAEQIALWEDEPSIDHYERVLTSLHHAHLPPLVEGGLVDYDVGTEEVQGLPAIDAVRPYLDVALPDDIR